MLNTFLYFPDFRSKRDYAYKAETVLRTMESGATVALSQEQIDALAASGQQIVYITDQEQHEPEQEEQQQVKPQEGEEVLIFDEESGQYQRCLYVQQQSGEEAENAVDVGEQQEEEQQFVIMPDALEQQQEQPQNQDENGELMVVPCAESDNAELLQCGKCEKTFHAADFEAHFTEVHMNEQPAVDSNKVCPICQLELNKQEYVTHFKEEHPDVRLGCTKCDHTYHDPELLNAHYRLHHAEEQQQQRHGDVMWIQHIDEQDTMSHPHQQQPQQQRKQKSLVTNVNRAPKPKKPKLLDCQICLKSFETQRDFANHRRRKGFCRPPFVEEPPHKRRIGIIRKSL